MTASISLQTTALIAGLVFSGFAALAACAGIWMAVRADRRARQPSLRVQPLVSPMTRFYGAAITNVGDGTASGSHFVVADTATFIMAPILNGFLLPGETVEVFATCPPAPSTAKFSVVGFVTGRDRFGFVHDWTTAEKEFTLYQRTLKSRFRKTPMFGDIGARLGERFPDRRGLEDLTQVRVWKQARTKAR